MNYHQFLFKLCEVACNAIQKLQNALGRAGRHQADLWAKEVIRMRRKARERRERSNVHV